MKPITIKAYDWPELKALLKSRLGYQKVDKLWDFWCEISSYPIGQHTLRYLPIGYWGWEDVDGREVPAKPEDEAELEIWAILEEVRKLIKPTDSGDYQVYVWW